MALYAITWQKNSLQPHPKEQEARIIAKIKTLEHFNDPNLKHVWFVSTTWSEERLYRYLRKQFEAPDRLLIEKSGGPLPYSNEFASWSEKSVFVKTPDILDKKEREGWPTINQDRMYNWRHRMYKKGSEDQT